MRNDVKAKLIQVIEVEPSSGFEIVPGLDALTFATNRQMYAAYVPSMRNGRKCDEEPREDRGNAIISTLPLSEVTAVELPFAQQRRVAVAATIRTAGGVLHVMSVHLDTALRHRRQAQGCQHQIAHLGGSGTSEFLQSMTSWSGIETGGPVPGVEFCSDRRCCGPA